MQFIDLQHQQKRISARIMENISKVLAHGQYILGPEIAELEAKLREYVRVKHAVSCSSGTDALLMALMAYGVGPGDAIFTTPFTFVATAEVITLLGATPVFVDIDPDTFNMDPDSLLEALSALEEGNSRRHPLPKEYKGLKPKGIIAVDLFGQPADYGRINTIASERGIFVIEDAAQSFGAEYHGSKACSLAEIAATSFFPAKPLGCYGDAGMVFTNSDELAERLESIRVHGKGSDKYDNIRIGINGRCDTLQAAILLAKFEIFPEEIEMRQDVAGRYTQLFGMSGQLKSPHIGSGIKSAWAQYTVVSKQRGSILEALKKEKIPNAIYYPKSLHVQGAYKYLGYKQGDFPVSENASDSVFSLPMHPYLTAQDQARIAEVIVASLKPDSAFKGEQRL
jgi:UDP-2-acetamido-2-deoxy-ribo-hexuluronate aminotransferase